MQLKNCKVYKDGRHFIAIPPDGKKRCYKRVHKADATLAIVNFDTVVLGKPARELLQYITEAELVEVLRNNTDVQKLMPSTAQGTTYKQCFDALYKDCKGMSRNERVQYLTDNLLPYFPSVAETRQFVQDNLARKKRNRIVRRIGIKRKVDINPFNYFVTFTYDSARHTEQSFRSQLKTMLAHNANRKGWAYLGVWERGKTDRLHFHALMNIPNGTMPGELVEVRDYSTTDHKMQVTMQNTYYNEKFGRTDFELLDNDFVKEIALSYITKYLEKSGERMSCSKGLCKYIKTDIDVDDVICDFGVDDRKKILFDDFKCIVNGKVVGTADDPSTLAQMPKCN